MMDIWLNCFIPTLIAGLAFGIVIGISIEYYIEKPKKKRKNVFQIVSSDGGYDVRFNGRRLTSMSTYDKAKSWLEHHKDNYLKEDSLIYEEIYEESTKVL